MHWAAVISTVQGDILIQSSMLLFFKWIPVAGNSSRIGNGYCDDENNNDECNFDGGDCCLTSPNTDYCSECTCHHKATCAAGVTHGLVGDAFCNDAQCRLFNAHWQKDLFISQIENKKICKKHEKILTKMKNNIS